MFVVDTNVLVAAAMREHPTHRACRARLEAWRASNRPWYITWSVVYEFLRVVTHARIYPKPLTTEDAWTFVEAILASPSAGVLEHTPRHSLIAGELIRDMPEMRGNDVHDVHIAILMREHGIRRLYTQDRGFRRFDFIEVLDPLD